MRGGARVSPSVLPHPLAAVGWTELEHLCSTCVRVPHSGSRHMRRGKTSAPWSQLGHRPCRWMAAIRVVDVFTGQPPAEQTCWRRCLPGQHPGAYFCSVRRAVSAHHTGRPTVVAPEPLTGTETQARQAFWGPAHRLWLHAPVGPVLLSAWPVAGVNSMTDQHGSGRDRTQPDSCW